MNMLTRAIYGIMVADGTLTALLATYGGEPAIFTTDPAPPDATRPYIVTVGAVALLPADTKTTLGIDARRDIRCYADADGSAGTVEAIAWRVRELFHRQAVAMDDYSVWWCDVTSVVNADEPGVYGRVVTVRLVADEV